jgi:DNA polymerase III alpha subunit (gram-positive type)
MRSGHVEVERIKLDVPAADLLRNEFIAFDVETTGLNPTSDRMLKLVQFYLSMVSLQIVFLHL